MLDCHTHNLTAADALIAVPPHQVPDGTAIAATSRLAVGLHPWQLRDDNTDDIDMLDRAAALATVAAIGETGLDHLRGPAMERQLSVFRHHIALAERLGKPLVIHCVRATAELVRLWRDTAPHGVAALIHGFRGNANTARTLLDEGFYLSYGHRFNADALRLTPRDRLLVETDDAPTDIRAVVAALAAALDIDAAALAALAARNLEALLHL